MAWCSPSLIQNTLSLRPLISVLTIWRSWSMLKTLLTTLWLTSFGDPDYVCWGSARVTGENEVING